jgi:hypothetical protein
MPDDTSRNDDAGATDGGDSGADGGKDSGALEQKLQWGTGTAGAKPRHVAVRKEGDVAEAMKPSATDAVYLEETAEESKAIAKERKLGVVLLVIFGALFVAFVAWNILHVEVSVSGEAVTLHSIKEASVTVKVETTHDVQVELVGIADAKAVSPGESELSFSVPLDKLKLGVNEVEVAVKRNGSVIKSTTVTVHHDFKLTVDKGKVANPPHTLYLNFKVGAGTAIRFNGKDYKPDSAGKAQINHSLKDVFDNLDQQRDAQFRRELPLTIKRANGEQVAHTERVDVMLPQSKLDLGGIGDALLVPTKSVVIEGTVDPGALVMVVDATERVKKQAEVAEDGSFSVKVKLLKSKRFDYGDAKDLQAALTKIRDAVAEERGYLLTVMTKVGGKVPSTRDILVVKVKAGVAKKFDKLASSASK